MGSEFPNEFGIPKLVWDRQARLEFRSLANKLLFNFFLSSMANRGFSYIIING